jgi:hypothetical protein
MTDLADNAAALAAGWTRVQTDRGVGRSPRFTSEYEKPTIGAVATASGTNTSGGFGGADASQAAADTIALAALNGFRRLRYGADATAGKDGRGGQHTHDST